MAFCIRLPILAALALALAAPAAAITINLDVDTTNSAHSGDSPVQNWGGVGVDVFKDVDGLQGPVVNQKMEKHYACWHCPLACGAESVESDNPQYPYPHHF